ncbi:hypothetical protein [Campylobacter concisus]
MLDKISKKIEAFFVRIKNNFLNMNIEKKFYSIALIFFILFFIIGLFPLPNATKVTIMSFCNIIAVVLVCLGFVFWMALIIKKLWNRWIGKIIIALLNFTTFFISRTFSKILIADTFGLPVKDFGMTSEMLTLVLYLPILFLLLSIVCIVVYVVQIVCIFLLEIPSVKSILVKFFPNSNLSSMAILARIIALCIISGILWYVGLAFLFIVQDEKGFVKAKMMPFLAYWCDYQIMPKYPNLQENQRVILHDNGVVSYVKYNDQGKIEIFVEKYK